MQLSLLSRSSAKHPRRFALPLNPLRGSNVRGKATALPGGCMVNKNISNKNNKNKIIKLYFWLKFINHNMLT